MLPGYMENTRQIMEVSKKIQKGYNRSPLFYFELKLLSACETELLTSILQNRRDT
jgi:hypothetical protein